LERANWEVYEAMTQMDVSEEPQDVNELVEQFVTALRTAASIAIPMSRGGSPKHRVPWWTTECGVANAERKRALRRYQRSGEFADKIAYNRARARALHVKNEARKNSWCKYITSLNTDTPMSKIWERVRKMKGHNSCKKPCLVINGALTAEPQQVADALAEKFSSISSNTQYLPAFRTHKREQEEQGLNFTTAENCSYNEPFTMLEIYHALKKCKNTAPGPDGIRYKMLKRMHPTAFRKLLFIYNKIWSTHVYPNQWRTALVLAFAKPHKPPTCIDSYRPIALTSCVGKLLERIVNVRLMRWLEAEELLNPVQFGYRQLRGTTDALVRFQNHLVQNNTARKQTLCIFFDLFKAYDTAWRHGIMQRVHVCGLRGNMAHFLQQFLNERTFRVKVGNTLSPLQTQQEGLPQGSVMSCTLFSLALNEITSNLPASVVSSLYVDDFLMYSSSTHLPALTRRMQMAINNVNSWAM
jgi:hypothetical protein